MESNTISFDEQESIQRLRNYLPAQAVLKDFVHHNTLHAFQKLPFFEALKKASTIFGYRVTLSLEEFRTLFQKGQISEAILDQKILDKKGRAKFRYWKNSLLERDYNNVVSSRIGQLRENWKAFYKINLNKIVHPFLFRIISSYLDQGIAIRKFPLTGLEDGFLEALIELEKNAYSSLFKTRRAKTLLLDSDTTISSLLKILIGDESLFEQYLFDQQFAHPGWSGMVNNIEHNPNSLLDPKIVSLKDFILFELLLEIDALDQKLGENWEPLGYKIEEKPDELFSTIVSTELSEVLELWQDAFEWTYYDEVLAGVRAQTIQEKPKEKSFQALFCIDDREYSFRRNIERTDPNSETFATPGFFGVEFYFQPENSKFYTKACPAPVNPNYLVKEVARKSVHQKDFHYSKHAHFPIRGWLITQTMGFWSAFKLFINIFKPSISPATAYSFQHMDKHSKLSLERDSAQPTEGGLQQGFSIEEMAERVENTLKSIGLVDNFAPIIYIVGHGASSVNNTHYAGYDCGACCGRPGAVNARAFSYMANHPRVRALLQINGFTIPTTTQFLGGMHDTTRDEIEFYDEDLLSPANASLHTKNRAIFLDALEINAKERARRFDTINIKKSLKKIHEKVKKRSVSLFEPRPELNHATNALCIVGRGALTKKLFLDRRPFMNSYDYRIDPEGNYLLSILNAAAPVCGGINLEYYFSRVDNAKLGAGTKLSHNVIGLFAVANGVDGDLRPGLPSQMVEVHDPIRLLFVVEHYPEVVLKTIQRNKATYEWFINNWVHLAVINPDTREVSVFKGGSFHPYSPLKSELPQISEIFPFIENNQGNIPVIQTS
ncbi:YbcC family protein [Flexithrix dorotheae]|uniref:YbcC family protein n=1 Tax=Flexithrix dorotheae TaxID=70993 RepID=UPI000369FDB6|nr:DUF2309 domain-containing protein [Flexithrix dorotheae]